MAPMTSRIDSVTNCRRAVDAARAVVATVRPRDLASPTPCTEWDVRALIAHMTGVSQAFAGALLDEEGADAEPEPAETPRSAEDLTAAFARATDAAMRGWSTPGALERTLRLPWGAMPAAMGERIFVGDLLMHTWDLAKALGRPYAMDEDLAAAQLETMRRFYDPATRGPGQAFAAAVDCPDDAPAQDRLVALSGRRP
jgi:uncharacterized protein (TIGR03086 family)